MGIFCEHGYLRECPHGCEDSSGLPGISGETCPKLGVASLVPKDRKESDVRLMRNPDTGHKEKMFYHWGLGEWCSSVKDTERKCAKKGYEIVG